MVVLRQQIKNHGQQQNKNPTQRPCRPAPTATAASTRHRDDESPDGGFTLPPTRSMGGRVSSDQGPFPPPHRKPIYPTFAHPQFDCTHLSPHPQHRTAGIERLVTDAKLAWGVVPPSTFHSNQQSKSSVDAASSDRGRNGGGECTSYKGGHGGGTDEFQGWKPLNTQAVHIIFERKDNTTIKLQRRDTTQSCAARV